MRQSPPFRADHVGSLLRPPELLKAREDRAQGRITAEALRCVEDAAIRQAVTMQEDIGLQGITDGEFRRASWHMDFLYQIGGVTTSQDRQKARFHNDAGNIEFTPTALHITGTLQLKSCIFDRDFKFLASVTNRTSEASSMSSGRETGHAQIASGRHNNEPRCDISAKAKPPLP